MSDSLQHPTPEAFAASAATASSASSPDSSSASSPASPSLAEHAAAGGTQSEQSAHDALLVLHERACGEMQLAGRRLQRQMQDYQAVLLEIQQLERVGTPQAKDKLVRLDALLDSDSFQRESREIERMAVALAGAIERLNAQAPAPRDEDRGIDRAADGATNRVPARGPVMRRACA